MALVLAECPECGKTVTVDSSKKAATCEFCKQPFVVEEAVLDTVTESDDGNAQNIQHLIDDILVRFNMGMKRRNDYNDGTLKEALIDLNSLREENKPNLYLKYLCMQKDIEIAKLLLEGETLNTCCSLSRIIECYDYLKEAGYKDINNCTAEVESLFYKINEIIMSGNVVVNQGFHGGYSKVCIFSSNILWSQVNLVVDFLCGECIEPYKSKINEIKAYIESLDYEDKRWQVLMYGRFEIYKDYYGEYAYLAKLEKTVLSPTDVDKYYQYLKHNYEKYINECIERKVCSRCGSNLSIFGKCKKCSKDDNMPYSLWRDGNTNWVRG